MTQIQKITNPNNPESYKSSFYTAFIGRVVSLDDPEKLGRIQVVCEKIGDQPIPNGNDGWIELAVPFVLSGSAGGQSFPIETGCQVLVVPCFNDITQCVAIACLHSRKSRPSPTVDPLKNQYGTHTRGDRIEVYDDDNSRHIETYPNGTNFMTDSDGTYTISTQKGAFTQIRPEGDITIGNVQGSMSISEKGVTDIRNADGGGMTVGDNGAVFMRTKGQPEVRLDHNGLTTIGQASPAAQVAEQLMTNLGGSFNRMKALMLQLNDIAEVLPEAAQPWYFLSDLNDILPKVIDNLSAVPKGKKNVEKMKDKFSPQELGEDVMGQVDMMRETKVEQLITILKEVGVKGKTGEEIYDILLEELEGTELDIKNLDAGVLIDKLKQLLDFFEDKTEEENIAAIVDLLIPEGAASISSLFAFGLFDQLPFNGIANLELPFDIDDIPGLEMVRNLKDLDGKLHFKEKLGELIPEDFQESAEPILDLLEDLPTPTSLLGMDGFIESLDSVVTTIEGFMADIEGLMEEVNTFIEENLKAIADNKLLEEKFGQEIFKLLDQLIEDFDFSIGQEEKAEDILALIQGLIDLKDVATVTDLSKIPPPLKIIEEYHNVEEFREKVIEPDYVVMQEVLEEIDKLIVEVSQEVIPGLIKEITGNLEEKFGDNKAQDFNRLIDKINPNYKGANTFANEEKFRLSANGGNTGGMIEGDRQKMIMAGPLGKNGLGTQIVAQQETLSLQTPGTEEEIGSEILMDAKQAQIKAPGANGSLGSLFIVDQGMIKLSSPGTERKAGSCFQIEQKEIYLTSSCAEGGGSYQRITPKEITLSAPGGKQDIGSKVILGIREAIVQSPGASIGLGTTAKFKSDRFEVKTANGPHFEVVSDAIPNNRVFRISANESLLDFGKNLRMIGSDIQSSAGAEIAVEGNKIRLSVGTLGDNGFTAITTFEVTPGGCFCNGVAIA